MSIWILADILVLVVIGIFGYFSMKRGFLQSSYNGISSFVAILLVFSLHAPFQGYLENSFVGDTVKDKIRTKIETSLYKDPNINKQSPDASDTEKIVDGLDLPDFLTSLVESSINNQKNNYNTFKYSLTESITEIIFPVVMQILSILFLYFGIRLLLWIGLMVLKLFAEIPVFGTLDRALGVVVGGVNALLSIYIVSFLISLLIPSKTLIDVELGINSTLLYKHFYFNNLITNLFF